MKRDPCETHPQDSMTTAQRAVRARAATYRLHSLYDSRELTKAARAAFNDRFVVQVDPDMRLPEAERRRRAECAARRITFSWRLISASAANQKVSLTVFVLDRRSEPITERHA